VSAPIFISYSSLDREIAETICQALEARGHDCCIACRDVHPGENFREEIVKALRSAQMMLLVFTSNANNSDEIKKDLVLAGRNHVTVVPVRIEDVVPNDAFTYEFATRQWTDLLKDWEHEIQSLAEGIPSDRSAGGGRLCWARRRDRAAALKPVMAGTSPAMPPRGPDGGGFGWRRKIHTRSTKLSTTRFSPALSN